MMSATGPTPAASTAGQPLGWQARKSASTRLQIVEAALRCFVDHGYFRTTTALIAGSAVSFLKRRDQAPKRRVLRDLEARLDELAGSPDQRTEI